MLFDLQGKRRRLIQATYLTLAILMGGGLVLFGIGSDVQGGLADIFSGSGGSSNPVAEDQLESAEERLQANPNDADALAELIQANFQLATTTDEEARSVGALFSPDAQPRLEAAADAWERYQETVQGKPDETLAFLMIQVFGASGLNRPEEAAEAARIVAEERRSTQAYLILTQYAALAGDQKLADMAAERAVELAPQAQRRQVERQVESLKRAGQLIQQQNAPPGAEGSGPPGAPPLPGDEGVISPGGSGGDGSSGGSGDGG